MNNLTPKQVCEYMEEAKGKHGAIFTPILASRFENEPWASGIYPETVVAYFIPEEFQWDYCESQRNPDGTLNDD